MEHALVIYYKVYENWLSGCEGHYELLDFKDFCPAIADHFVEVLQCKVDCEADLTPKSDDEAEVGYEKEMDSLSDAEFKGVGDYKEVFLAQWWQEQ
ncbi:UNVERIFIED_CONTAM: hypothetical protein K2H54_054772 [Gekko kuhli]